VQSVSRQKDSEGAMMKSELYVDKDTFYVSIEQTGPTIMGVKVTDQRTGMQLGRIRAIHVHMVLDEVVTASIEVIPSAIKVDAVGVLVAKYQEKEYTLVPLELEEPHGQVSTRVGGSSPCRPPLT
jgi:hypothetical protein